MRRLFDHNRSIVRFSGIIIGLSFMVIVLSTRTMACPIELPITTISINGHRLAAELATTPTTRSCGLSHRDQLPKNHGMLFVFPDRRPRTFWMKDTTIPLSIAFLDDSGQILSIQDMVPLQTEPEYHSSQPARYALEVNQGWFSRRGVEAGDVVELKLPLILDIR